MICADICTVELQEAVLASATSVGKLFGTITAAHAFAYHGKATV